MKHLVIGMGEVGTAIQKVFQASYHDKFKASDFDHWKQSKDKGIMHVCIPYSETFCNEVLEYEIFYKPTHIVVHSTVPVGTCASISASHSPIRGLHPNLYEGVMTFEKFIGGPDASLFADEFRRAGLKIIIVDKAETTELGKLLDTEYYRSCIVFMRRAKALCDSNRIPFHEAYTLFNQTYNHGYQKLGHEEYVRPVLQPIMSKIIGGHCVEQNKVLLPDAVTGEAMAKLLFNNHRHKEDGRIVYDEEFILKLLSHFGLPQPDWEANANSMK